MPIFPNINTLSLKDLLSGKETIQISASERTTLERIAQLAMAQPVAGFISTLEQSLGGTAITTSDSLLAALEKLYARVGGDESALFPITYDVYWGICGILPSSEGSSPGLTNYFLFAILFNSEEGMRPYIWYGNHNDMALYESNSTPEAIVDWLESNGKHSPLSSPDEFYKSTSSGTLNLSPGRVITCEDQLPNFSLHSSEWVKPNIIGGQNFTVSIVSRTNITQSKFTVTNGNPSFPGGVELLFMEDFDMDPGTEWQAVTVQLFVSGNTYRFFINKCGYNPKNS